MKKHIHFTERATPKNLLLIIILSFLLLNTSCKKFDVNENAENDFNNYQDSFEKCGNHNSNNSGNLTSIESCGTPLVSNLMAGQNSDIGSVSVYNTADSLFIDLFTVGNWWLQSASAYVGVLSGMPQAPNGNPKVGQFPYQKTLNPKKKVVRFGIPLSGLPACFIVAVHAEVRKVINGQTVQCETAWGQGQNLPGPNWAMGISYCKQACVSCDYSTTATTLKAEEKQICGQVLVTNNADSLYVTYQMFDGWKLRKIHLYAGTYNAMPVDGAGNPSYNSFPKTKVYSNPVSGSVTIGYGLNNLPANYIVAVHAETERTINGSGVLIESAWGFGDAFINAATWGWTIPYSTQFCN